jgi:hypothetical protein
MRVTISIAVRTPPSVQKMPFPVNIAAVYHEQIQNCGNHQNRNQRLDTFPDQLDGNFGKRQRQDAEYNAE